MCLNKQNSFLCLLLQVKCDAAHLINPDKINPGVVIPKVKKETLGFYVLVSDTIYVPKTDDLFLLLSY